MSIDCTRYSVGSSFYEWRLLHTLCHIHTLSVTLSDWWVGQPGHICQRSTALLRSCRGQEHRDAPQETCGTVGTIDPVSIYTPCYMVWYTVNGASHGTATWSTEEERLPKGSRYSAALMNKTTRLYGWSLWPGNTVYIYSVHLLGITIFF